MAKTPEFVVTGVHVPGVHFCARVLVAPERLQRVKSSILRMGFVHLRPGEVLEIDTRVGEDLSRAVTAGDPDAKAPLGACLAAWNGADDITVFADDADHVAAIAEPVRAALLDRQPDELISRAVWLHCDRIASIRVGGVQVFFDRSEDRKKEGPSPEEPADDEPAPRKRENTWRDLRAGDFDGLSDATCGEVSSVKVAEAHLKILKAAEVLRKAGLLPEGV